MKRTIAQVCVVGAVLAAGLTGTAGAAYAVDVDCISVYGPPAVQDSILLINRYCGTTVRVKIIEAHGPDSGCYTLAPGQEKTWNRPWYSVGRYDGLASC